MTQPWTRSPNSFPCLIRPAHVSDRKTIEQLVRKFHQSLQLGSARTWLAIVLVWVALLVVFQ